MGIENRSSIDQLDRRRLVTAALSMLILLHGLIREVSEFDDGRISTEGNSHDIIHCCHVLVEVLEAHPRHSVPRIRVRFPDRGIPARSSNSLPSLPNSFNWLDLDKCSNIVC